MGKNPNVKRGGPSSSPASGFRVGRRQRQQPPLHLRISEFPHNPNNNLGSSDRQEGIEWEKPSLLERIRSATPPLLSRIQPLSPENEFFTSYETENSTTSHTEDPGAVSDCFHEQAEEFLEQEFRRQRSLEVVKDSGDSAFVIFPPRRLAQTYNRKHIETPKHSSPESRSPSKSPQVLDRSDRRLDSRRMESGINSGEDERNLTNSEETLVVTAPDAPQTMSASEPNPSILGTSISPDANLSHFPMDIDAIVEPCSSSGSSVQHPRSDPKPESDGLQRNANIDAQSHQHVVETVYYAGKAGPCASTLTPATDPAPGEVLEKPGTPPKTDEAPGASLRVGADAQHQIDDPTSSPQPKVVSEPEASLLPMFIPDTNEQIPDENDPSAVSPYSQEHDESMSPLTAPSSPTLEDRNRSIERCREILLPIILQNLDSRGRSRLMSLDVQTLKPAISNVLTDAQCVEFMQLSQTLQGKLAGTGKTLEQLGLQEHHIRDFVNTVRAGMKTLKAESVNDGLAQFKSAVDISAPTDNSAMSRSVVLPTDNAHDASNDPPMTSEPLAEPLDLSTGNVSYAAELGNSDAQVGLACLPAGGGESMEDTQPHNAEHIHLNEINSTPLNVAASGNGSDGASLLSAQTDSLPLGMSFDILQSAVDNGQIDEDIDQEMEEGELPGIDHSVLEEHPVRNDSFVGSLITRAVSVGVERKDEYISEKRQGKRRAVEEDVAEDTVMEEVSDGIEEGEVNEKYEPHGVPSHRAEPQIDRLSSTQSLSPSPLPPGSVPGIWFVQVGEKYSDILKASFVVNKEIKEGVERWCRNDFSEPWQKQISLHIQCILKADVAEVNQRLGEQDCSESEATQALWEVPCNWPSAGQLLVQVNIDQGSKVGKTWFSHEISQGKPVDISSSVLLGTNSMHLVQLGDLSDCVFVLHALEHSTPTTDSDPRWTQYGVMLGTNQVTTVNI